MSIGPASADVKTLEMLMDAGMNIARLNFSHGTHDYHLKTVENLRKAVKSYSEKICMNFPLAIALDTKGPEIRTGVLNGEDASKEIKLNKGDTLRLSTDKQYEKIGSNKLVYVDYGNITKVLKENDIIYVDDGLILMTVMKIGKQIPFILGSIKMKSIFTLKVKTILIVWLRTKACWVAVKE